MGRALQLQDQDPPYHHPLSYDTGPTLPLTCLVYDGGSIEPQNTDEITKAQVKKHKHNQNRKACRCFSG
jgi:hypothetical protein